MSFIQSLEIHGFMGSTGIRRIEFKRDINVITGPNGSGKTSLIKIIESAFTGDITSIRSIRFNYVEARIYSTILNGTVIRTISKNDLSSTVVGLEDVIADNFGTMTIDGLDKQGRPKFRRAWKSKFDENVKNREPNRLDSSWAHRYLPTNRIVRDGASRSKNLPAVKGNQIGEDELNQIIAQQINANYERINLLQNRKIAIAQGAGMRRVLQSVIGGIRVDSLSENKGELIDDDLLQSLYKSMCNVTKREGFSSDSNISIEDLRAGINRDARLLEIFKEFHEIESRVRSISAPLERFKESLSAYLGGNLKISFGSEGIEAKTMDGKEVELKFLSSGQKQIIGILVECILAEENLFMVDEPEISLHIEWQQKLVSSLTLINPLAQIILATHSPEIAASVSSGNEIALTSLYSGSDNDED